MSNYYLIIFGCILICNSCSDNANNFHAEVDTQTSSEIFVSEFNTRPVIGLLGSPLGTPIKIKATIFDGRAMKDKIHSSSFLLEVTHVNDAVIPSKPVLKFSLDHAENIGLATDNFELFHIRHGKNAEKLNSEEIEKLKIGYVGKQVSLLVYETGEFSGVPSDLPDRADLWQGHGFGFESKLEVLYEIK